MAAIDTLRDSAVVRILTILFRLSKITGLESRGSFDNTQKA